MKNIIFIGGIHGSGKGTICETLKNKIDLIHLTASEVLKWNELSTKEEKLVTNINETQNRLVINLNKIVEENKTYLLDGHYCLLNNHGKPEKIPIQTFKDINPKKLILVIANPETIKKRLEKRDAKTYDIDIIEEFQNLEINFATDISEILEIPLHIINSEQLEIETLLYFLK
ncbi:adenylate kinase [Flavobacterium sp. 1]|uniref:ATP-binding protein n=1 Tax=Flavobacterium sp. 1 TaxID=2035200 RepID=UPI000C2339CA|nr:ATP-binding protein [Flavobacterium sp. 1]PJJ07564.1 adenylate kinase [Flavobacterium sp. 1]